MKNGTGHLSLIPMPIIEVTVERIKAMREETGMGLEECKNLLVKQNMQEKLRIARETRDFDLLCEVTEYLLLRR
jgi:hypothetical protein